MKSSPWVLVLVLALGSIGSRHSSWAAGSSPDDRVALRFDMDEPEAVLAILARVRAGEPIENEAWQRLFATQGYVRLKRREAEMHRDFTDDEFKQFVLSPALAQRADSLERTLAAWKASDLSASARRVERRLRSDDEIQKVGFTFFGVQGPWYTVGYRMAVVVERRFGRASLIECMLDPRLLVARYNAAAADANRIDRAGLATWSPRLTKVIGAAASP